MAHEDLLGLPLDKAVTTLENRGIVPVKILWTCAPKAPQEEGTARVVALREEGRVLVAARFLDGIPGEQA